MLPNTMQDTPRDVRKGLATRIAATGLLIGLLFVLAGCKPQAQAPRPQAPPPVVTVAHPVQRQVTDYAEFTGRVEAVDAVQVRARVSGHLVKVLFTEGTEVEKGDVLFEIDPRPYQAQLNSDQARLQKAQAEARKAQSDFERYQEVIATGAASRFEYDSALAERDSTLADVAAATAAVETANLNLEFCTVRAPIDGRVSSYTTTVGNLVSADDTVLTNIVSTDPMHVTFAVDELTYLRVKDAFTHGSAADGKPQIPVMLGLADEQGYTHQGAIDFADNQLRPSMGTLRVRAVFSNADRLLTPGLFARVRVPLGEAHAALLVPDRAIDSDQGQKVLLTVNEKSQVVTRPVQVGALHDGLRAIADGLDPADRVIVNGLVNVRPGMVVQAEDQATAAAAAPVDASASARD